MPPKRPVPTFNIVDHGDTSQNTLSTLLSSHFSIPSTYTNALLNSFAKLHLDSVIDDVNDETLDPWANLLAASANVKAASSPISPFVEREALLDKGLCLDGGAFERETGFKYRRERVGMGEVGEVVESYRRMGWWP